MKLKTCVFPVAGLGTRFLPATKSIPKEMLPVGNKPLIQYAVEEAKAAGIQRFIFVTAQGKSAIEDHFDPSPKLMAELERRGAHDLMKEVQRSQLMSGEAIYIRQSAPLGLGNAVFCARNLIDDDLFAVILADDLIQAATPCLAQMREVYEPSDGHLLACLTVPQADAVQYGIISHAQPKARKASVSQLIEKPKECSGPQSAIIGRYLLQKTIFEQLAHLTSTNGHELQLTDAIAGDLKQTGVTGFFFEGKRYDCGKRQGWLQANNEI
jgi:UTP--glucose-1-phosphate uridylyltransferase